MHIGCDRLGISGARPPPLEGLDLRVRLRVRSLLPWKVTENLDQGFGVKVNNTNRNFLLLDQERVG